MTKKNVIDELIKYELTKLDELLNVLECGGYVKIPKHKGYLSESDAWRWFEDNPTEAEKKRVLADLDYDISKL